VGLAEGKVEDHLKREVEKMGGLCFKMTGYKGIPDRLVLLPRKPAMFIELKADNGDLSHAQMVRCKQLTSKGHIVQVLKGIDGVDEWLIDLQIRNIPAGE
jgi:hypothetical protein